MVDFFAGFLTVYGFCAIFRDLHWLYKFWKGEH